MERRTILKQLIDERCDGNAAAFSRAINKAPAQVHQWLAGHRNLGDAGARHIEMTFPGLWQGFFDGKRANGSDAGLSRVVCQPISASGVSTIGSRINATRLARKLKITDLAKLVGMSSAAIGQIESGVTNSPTPSNLLRIADALKISFRYLITGKKTNCGDQLPPDLVDKYANEIDDLVLERSGGCKLPVISWTQAGNDSSDTGAVEGRIFCPAIHSDDSYALRVRGDSMVSAQGVSYPAGCIIFVDTDQRDNVNVGDRVIAKVMGLDDAVFMRLDEDLGKARLMPLNSQYSPITDDFSIVGKVIGKWES